MRFGGLGGLGGHFIANIIKRIAGKLQRSILLDFGLVTSRIHYWNTRKVILFMVLGPGGRDHDSPNQLFLILEAPRYFKKSKKILKLFLKYHLWKYDNLET